MREDVAAVDIGRNWFTVARLSADIQGQYRLLHAGLAMVHDEWDDAALAKALRRFWRRDRIPTRSVCVGVRSRAVSTRYFRFPAMTDAELTSALRLEASELLALERNEIVWDWYVNPATGTDNRTEGILVAAPRREIEARMRLLRSAGLFPVRLDTPGLAVARLIGRSAERPGPGDTLAILNLGGSQADLVILSQTMIFPRTLLRDTGSWEDDPAELTTHITDAVRYAQYSLKLDRVTRLYLTGIVTDREPLIRHLGAHSGLDVECWDPVERLGLRLRTSWRTASALQTMPTALTSSLGLALLPDPS